MQIRSDMLPLHHYTASGGVLTDSSYLPDSLYWRSNTFVGGSAIAARTANTLCRLRERRAGVEPAQSCVSVSCADPLQRGWAAYEALLGWPQAHAKGACGENNFGTAAVNTDQL